MTLLGKVIVYEKRDYDPRFVTLQEALDEEALVEWDRAQIVLPAVDTDIDPGDEVPRILGQWPVMEWKNPRRAPVPAHMYAGYPFFTPKYALFYGPRSHHFREPDWIYVHSRWFQPTRIAERVLSLREQLQSAGMSKQDAKQIEFGAVYGMGPEHLLNILNRNRRKS